LNDVNKLLQLDAVKTLVLYRVVLFLGKSIVVCVATFVG
jgi:hypothetical protein